jgi:hypothetical protein
MDVVKGSAEGGHIAPYVIQFMAHISCKPLLTDEHGRVPRDRERGPQVPQLLRDAPEPPLAAAAAAAAAAARAVRVFPEVVGGEEVGLDHLNIREN